MVAKSVLRTRWFRGVSSTNTWLNAAILMMSYHPPTHTHTQTCCQIKFSFMQNPCSGICIFVIDCYLRVALSWQALGSHGAFVQLP